MNPRLIDARARLKAALLSGGDTAAIRSQIASMELAEAKVAEAPVVDADRDERIARRAAELVRECEERAAAVLESHPVLDITVLEISFDDDE